MISRTKFVEQIEAVQEFNKVIDQLYEFKIDLVETPLHDLPSRMFDNFINVICTEDGQDLVFWWLYEDVPKVIWENEKEIPISTVDDLYDYLKTNNLFV